ncbi:hypothetical protein [Caballeronia ptereochthonis]|uniref:hypothetical protein n=1 Tax=Caballeronia ptereochthonis TaxID=1777144 RepID=UPI000B35DA30|nr:hypothetical protein [Caballeronia ptereochthonis]
MKDAVISLGSTAGRPFETALDVARRGAGSGARIEWPIGVRQKRKGVPGGMLRDVRMPDSEAKNAAEFTLTGGSCDLATTRKPLLDKECRIASR